MTIAQDEFRRTLGHFATGVTVVTVMTPEGAVHGMTANAFSSVSLEPPLVLVCVGTGARTHGLLPLQPRFGISVLREEQEAWARYFASSEQRPDAAEQLGVKFRMTEAGVALLEDSLASLQFTLAASHPAGDHTIFVGRVEEARIGAGRPLLFYGGRFRALEPGNGEKQR
jgi:flavin reductase (DIM6/NTAB) family NADH-FMN oxidoreductase RutF